MYIFLTLLAGQNVLCLQSHCVFILQWHKNIQLLNLFSYVYVTYQKSAILNYHMKSVRKCVHSSAECFDIEWLRFDT